jgi:RNA polymerase-interacting CarD/CdnL/TRCF family regulator
MDRKSNIQDLQAVSRHVLENAEQIKVLEEQKRHVEPTSDRFRALSDAIEALAKEIGMVSHAETSLAEDFEDDPDMPTAAEADEAS